MTEKRRKIEQLVNAAMLKLDPTGGNTAIWKERFSKMSDSQFAEWIKSLRNGENIRYEYHEFGEDAPTLDHAINASKLIGFNLYQYCYLPHITGDNDTVMRTPTKCMVGWINLKALQQMVEKKNGSSTSINIRDPKTGQVTSDDKNAGNSDMEATMILSYMDDNKESAIIKELHGFRSDDFTAKSEAYKSIQDKGYVSLDEITTEDNTGKMTLNLVNTYLIGAQIKSDLVSDSYLLPSTIGKKELPSI